MATNFARLRQQNLFPEIPDINAGIMGEINLPDVDFGGNPYDMGQVNLPSPNEPYFGGNYEVQNDPRSYVNPTIAGPNSVGAGTAQNLMDVINQIYTPETTSRDRFNRLLDAAPEREGPGLMRGLAAFGMGMGAKDPLDTLKVHEQVMYAPHHRNMADWTAKTQPFGQAAQFENTANINERTLAGNVATNITNQQRYDQQNAINEEKNRISQERAESDRIRAQAYDFKQRNPNWIIKTDGPRVMAYNPADPSQRPIDLGASGNMTEADKINLQNYGRIEAARQMGVNAAATAGINQSERWQDAQGNVYNLDPSQVGDARTMGLRPVTPGAPQFPSGTIRPVPNPSSAAVNPRVARNDKFRQFADERPDLAAKWLVPPISATGDWGIKPPPGPSGGFMGWGRSIDPNAINEYNQVRQALGLPPIPASTAPVQQQGPPQAVAKPGIGPSVAPPVPQRVSPPTDVFTQPQEYQDPFAQPPIQSGQNLGTVQGAIQGARESLRPQPNDPAIIASELAKGTRLTVTDPNTGKTVGSIPNTPQSIQAATNAGLRVEVK
jgi:hypothetical protein